ncbi:Retrovirus-related Pol polyprotein from transposon TNT 1-94 [Hypsizygus marmoreus]|uniref:Retrovirus-related Pol polyprotein from transposon TNT 1-94 n=1 Tax=Hypsizygus marmoreus TaxID=39966 RepID=A0A369J9P2_HYPMA|nr:Retrovirus-related Pol polyprotein from transposon TNT 1-94 [Hypsizygus marmoreus]
MSSPSNFLLPADERFDGSNWVEWKEIIWAAAKQRGVTGYLDGSIKRPRVPVEGESPAVIPTTVYWGSMTPTADEWEQRNAFAQGIVTLNIRNAVGLGVKTNGTASECWASLTSLRDAVSDLGRLHAESALRMIQYSDGTDIETHFKLLRRAWERATSQGSKIDDSDFRMVILGSMPKTANWNLVVGTMLSVKTSDEVISNLTLQIMVNGNGSSARASIPAAQALATHQQRSPQRSTEICTNPVCKRIGHTIERCFKPGGGMEGQYPAWWSKKGVSTNAVPSANSAMAPTATTVERYAFMADSAGAREVKVVTYADSAASEHCFVDRGDFETYVPFHGDAGATATKGGKFTIAGKGRVNKRITFDGRVVLLTFDAIHTPDLSHNLISIGRLDKAGCFTVFGGGGATFLNPVGAPFMYGQGSGTMYKVELHPPIGPITPRAQPTAIALTVAAATIASDAASAFAATRTSHTRPTDIDTWHRRLGHIGYASILKMVKGELVDGLDVTSLKQGLGMCEDCIMGKHSRRPFDGGQTKETKVLERVYIDLWGPARVQSTGGKLYSMHLVDGYCGHMEGYFLANKEAVTTLEAVKHYRITAELHTGNKIHYIRTDIGPEFVNHLWTDFCAEHGIIHETTSGYSSPSNGVAERSNRTVFERVRVLMHEAGLPPSMWCEVAATVFYLADFIPTSRHLDSVPFTAWRGVKPNVSHLRPFGCTAYAKIPTELGGSKLEVRSVKCVLIGYYGRDGYRLFDRSSGRIFRSRDVIFEEGTGNRTLPPLPEPTNEGEDHVSFDGPDPDLGDERAQGLTPVRLTVPALPSAPPPAIAAPLPAIPRRSTRISKPTDAILSSIGSEANIEAARRAGEAWANDKATPAAINHIQAYLTSLDNAAALIVDPDNNWVPNSYTEAMTRPDLWKIPMDREIENLRVHGVWKLVDRPPNVKPMQNRWTFANKYDADGKLVGRKARLVAKGFTQIPGVDYQIDNYASVVRYESLRMNLAIAAAKDMEAWQVDYVGAYLNASTQVPIIMDQPEGYEEIPGEGGAQKVALVTKALYGTMDGAYNWWETYDREMKELGYYRSQADQSVRARHADGETTITSTYTDDVNGISSTPEGAVKAREELGWTYETKDLGEARLILGIRIDRDRESGILTLSQRAYLERVLAKYGMSECSPRPTPLPLGVILNKEQAPSTPEERQFMKDKPYREVLGSVMYAQIATRPDLSYAVSTLSKFSSDPGKAHWDALTHVLRYIRGTLHFKITYGGKAHTDLAPLGYVDADYGGDTDTRRSCSGHVFIQAGGPTAWGAQYQQTVALSTTEAEYMSVTRSCKQILWMYSAMDEVGFPQRKPAVLLNDNAGAISLSKNTKHNSRVKHIDIRHHYIRERVEDGDVAVRYVPSAENLADLFTKPLGRIAHRKFCAALRLCEDDSSDDTGDAEPDDAEPDEPGGVLE